MDKRILILGLLALAPAVGFCDDPPPPPQDVWTGKGQAGYVAAHGNTDSTAANAALDMAFLDGNWKDAFHLGGLYGQSNSITSAERWDAMWQTDYSLTKDLYTFGNLHYTHDMFSGFDYQATASVGAGYKLINEATTKLDVQLGVGYGDLRPEQITKNPVGEVTARTLLPAESTGELTGAINYSQALTDTTTLSDKLLVEYNSKDTLITNTIALTVKISTKLALSLGYNIENNSAPPAPLKKLDTLTTFNLVYAF